MRHIINAFYYGTTQSKQISVLSLTRKGNNRGDTEELRKPTPIEVSRANNIGVRASVLTKIVGKRHTKAKLICMIVESLNTCLPADKQLKLPTN